MKVREFWVEATGNQKDELSEFLSSDHVIDLSNPGEDRWIYTTIQTVNPGTNSVAMKKKWLHLVEYSAYKEMKEIADIWAKERDDLKAEVKWVNEKLKQKQVDIDSLTAWIDARK